MTHANRKQQLQMEEAGEHLFANRVRVYQKSVSGPVRRIKWAVLALCLAVYYALPWLRWDRGTGHPNQAILLDIGRERFYFFGLTFWPQDIFYLTGLLIMAAVALFLVTSVAGRVWCGYTCPQTVWTDLFQLVERAIEGDRNERMKRDAAALSFDTVWRKVAKHAVWVGVAFWTGGAWIMYYADAPTVTVQFWTGRATSEVYFFTFLFTATTYLLAGWAREQVCTYMCPWLRFQSAMLDEHSLTVTYQAWRGEPRTRGKRVENAGGDCVDCGACVMVCPTGIDIRDGIQLECIGCGLCVDACDHVMARTGRPEHLIGWDTLAGQAAKAQGTRAKYRLFRPRTVVYCVALSVAALVMIGALATRPMSGLSVLRDRAPLFVRLADGTIRNGYIVKIVNKSREPATFVLAAAGIPGAAIAEPDRELGPAATLTLPVPGDSVGTFRILATGHPADFQDGAVPLEFSVRDLATGEHSVIPSQFMGPRAAGRH